MSKCEGCNHYETCFKCDDVSFGLFQPKVKPCVDCWIGISFGDEDVMEKIYESYSLKQSVKFNFCPECGKDLRKGDSKR